MSELDDAVAYRINEFRINLLKLGLTESQMAFNGNVHRRTVYNLMEGKGVNLKSALKLSVALGVAI